MVAEPVPEAGLGEQALQELMVRYQCADQTAASELVRQLSPALFRFLAGPSFTRAVAEDMLQDCWLRIHRARHTYRPGEPVLPWIYAIARHTRVDAFRRRRHIESHELAVDQYLGLAAHEERPSDPGLFRLVEALPESQRDAIFMLKVCGMSLDEVARATSSTVGAVKQRAHRAYEKLRCKLSQASHSSAKT